MFHLYSTILESCAVSDSDSDLNEIEEISTTHDVSNLKRIYSYSDTIVELDHDSDPLYLPKSTKRLKLASASKSTPAISEDSKAPPEKTEEVVHLNDSFMMSSSPSSSPTFTQWVFESKTPVVMKKKDSPPPPSTAQEPYVLQPTTTKDLGNRLSALHSSAAKESSPPAPASERNEDDGTTVSLSSSLNEKNSVGEEQKPPSPSPQHTDAPYPPPPEEFTPLLPEEEAPSSSMEHPPPPKELPSTTSAAPQEIIDIDSPSSSAEKTQVKTHPVVQSIALHSDRLPSRTHPSSSFIKPNRYTILTPKRRDYRYYDRRSRRHFLDLKRKKANSLPSSTASLNQSLPALKISPRKSTDSSISADIEIANPPDT